MYDLVGDDAQRAHAGARLSQLAIAGGLTIATGFVGTPLVCDELTITDHVDTAYGLLMQDQCPSWLYPVLQGATTIWERWDAITPEGRVNQDGIAMISFNHYALGAVADWLHRVVGGLAPASAGWREIRIAPQPGGGHSASASSRLERPTDSPRRVELERRHLTVDAIVPPNTTAHMRSARRRQRTCRSAPARTVDGAVRADGLPGSGYLVGRRHRDHDAQREEHG